MNRRLHRRRTRQRRATSRSRHRPGIGGRPRATETSRRPPHDRLRPDLGRCRSASSRLMLKSSLTVNAGPRPVGMTASPSSCQRGVTASRFDARACPPTPRRS
jgi:hypothetical protein